MPTTKHLSNNLADSNWHNNNSFYSSFQFTGLLSMTTTCQRIYYFSVQMIASEVRK